MHKSEQPEGVAARIDPNFPNVVRTDKLFEILPGNDRNFSNQIQCPGNFLLLFIGEQVYEIFNRALTVLFFVKDHLPPKNVNKYVNPPQPNNDTWPAGS